MRCLIIVALAAAVSIAVSACSFKSDAQIAAEAKVAIWGLIPEAAGITNESWAPVVASSHPGIHLYDSRPLTVGLAYHKVVSPMEGIEEALENRRKEFKIQHRPFEKVTAELQRSVDDGYRSIVQPDRITDITCEVKGNTATGDFTFAVPDVCQGTIQYSAENKYGRWRITEFRLPAHNWRFVVDDSGKWKWYDYFGDTEDPRRLPPAQEVTGSVTFEGQPASNAKIRVLNFDAPEFELPRSKTRSGEDGHFTAAWPIGRFAIQILCARPNEQIRMNCKLRDGSKMLIEVREGKNHFEFDLVESDVQYRY